MKVNEFRIGNRILIDDIITEVTGITKSTIYFKDGYQMFIAGGIEPIPLTEEWLLRFGFENNYIQYEWTNWGMWVEKGLAYEYIVSHGFANTKSELISIKYVHQLQNLYFALTGEELIYSPV